MFRNKGTPEFPEACGSGGLSKGLSTFLWFSACNSIGAFILEKLLFDFLLTTRPETIVTAPNLAMFAALSYYGASWIGFVAGLFFHVFLVTILHRWFPPRLIPTIGPRSERRWVQVRTLLSRVSVGRLGLLAAVWLLVLFVSFSLRLWCD
jgi:membrane-bound metal-dependent hydrolase YbcI (DUF457 family)